MHIVPAESRLRAGFLLAFLVPLPSLGVWLSMGIPGIRGSLLGQSLYFVGKVLFYAVPLACFLLEKPRQTLLGPLRAKFLAEGTLWGFILSLGVVFAISLITWLAIDLSSIRQAALQSGLDSGIKFTVLVLYLSFINSFMEEFVWRYFLFRQSLCFLSKPGSVLFINLAFSLHHFLALYYQTAVSHALLGALAVFAAGCLWSYLILSSKSLWSAYISHIWIDLAIFAWAGWIIFA